jgi:predicted Holliday junction resolvase-like endonuclease
MIIAYLIFVLIIKAVIIWRIYLFIQFGKHAKLQFAQSKNIFEQQLHRKQLDRIAEPAHHHFNHILKVKEKKPYINYVRLNVTNAECGKLEIFYVSY